MEGDGARRVGRREKKGIVSDDSEGSSLDSSDNEFEEQIRKMKVSEGITGLVHMYTYRRRLHVIHKSPSLFN